MALNHTTGKVVRDLFMPALAQRRFDEIMTQHRLDSAAADIWAFIANDKRAQFNNFSRHLKSYVDVLLRALDEEIRICLAAPPQHGKSTDTLFTLAYFCTIRKGLSHVYITYNDGLAKHQMRTFCAMLREQGIRFRKVANTVFVEGGAEAGGSSIRFMALGQGITGYPINGVVIIDDVLKGHEQASSLAKRDEIYEFVLGDVFSRKSKGRLSIIVMATRWHDDDLTGRLVRFHQWPYLRIPAICDSEDDLLGREIGEPLWPGGQSLESLEKERLNQGERRFSALWQGVPMPDGGYAFKLDVPRYEGRPKEGKWLVSYGLDMATGANKRSDWSVLVRLITDLDTNQSYVDRVWRMQCKMIDFLSYVQQAHAELPGTITWFFGGQERSIAEFMESVAKQGLKINLVPAATGGKLSRATHVIDAWNNNRVLLPLHETQQVTQFHGVVTSFTGDNDGIDDDVDALAGAYYPLVRRAPSYTGLSRKFIDRMEQMRRARRTF